MGMRILLMMELLVQPGGPGGGAYTHACARQRVCAHFSVVFPCATDFPI